MFNLTSCNNSTNNLGVLPAIDPANMDTTVSPGNDLFQYANGIWMKNHPIPEEYSQYGAFQILFEENNDKLKKLVDDLIADKNSKPGSVKSKISHFFIQGMDTVKIDELGIKPLQKYLDQINKIQTQQDVIAYISMMHSYGLSPVFNSYGYADIKNSDWVITQISQGGLGLPDRDYYLQDDERFKNIRNEYVKHIAKMFVLAGESEEKAGEMAQSVMHFETQLATASMSRLQRRDPDSTYHKMNFSELKNLVTNIDWDYYFNTIHIPDTVAINVAQPEFMKEVGNMLTQTSLDDWKNYLQWNLIDHNANYLSSGFVKQDFEFFGKTLSGRKKMRERWKRVMSATSRSIGEGIGQLYVEKYFPPEAKERMIELVMNLKKALKNRIENLDWMGDLTKEKALEKLDAMKVKIGYPDKWKDYSKLEVKDDSYVENMFRARKFATEFNYNKIGKKVDKDEWGMSPQTVNAYYSPTKNEIVFPAAILQFPFFNMAADDAVNYGSIGVVIGHEMTHGFDDQGRKFDKNGNRNDWWTEEDAKKFEERTQILVDEYNSFDALDSNFVDGKLTLGENIADFGGLTVAYEALKMSFKNNKEPADIDGFNYKQRFLLAFAQVWRQNITDKQLLRNLKEDVHSPGKFRVNGPIPNMPLFYEAFNVKPGDKLYIPVEKRAVIW
ncbi:MAG: M13 family metallopeptidase [Chlorobi bacterium]|nr:M13 family metallopeptidase [Chlorobiota bacterium]